ncbi:AbrB/MazE/SpoVT family DNA-binding domain-containing protein [Candidatus Microgenomates bacterium]|jgi:antitoxin component of MazEF toxin-antitoxin module|nr:MAG: AbrB/MazE/SpoVT family DNA-binding domain-containing protein [Candidatus Microgenomates bacterium]
MTQKVIRTGNSLAVTIPSDFVKSVGIRPGDEVRLITETDKGEITYVFSGAKQLPLSENFLKIRK